ncbi:MAG: hypothetical protein U5K43_09235 [Halofilum sp. (in: g-proteobacteria)]|nr:hypothetical protein [Halofilum sp. (in: g-proteobacteria)]
MAGAYDPTSKLSDAEKRDLIELIQADKPLPEKYRFLLFEDRREVELVWNGESPDVCNAVLPFQSFENEWQSFRTRKQRELELTTAEHRYDRPGRYTVAVKVVDIFGNDTMTLVPVNVG